jgi:hypothetical protein
VHSDAVVSRPIARFHHCIAVHLLKPARLVGQTQRAAKNPAILSHCRQIIANVRR